jgi:hypothetical protein
MKRSIRGIFYDHLETVKQHLHLNFSMDYASEYWLQGFMDHPKYINEKSAQSKIIRALYDLQ